MWNIPYIEVILGVEKINNKFVDITVTEQSVRFRNNGKKVHSCGQELPRGAIKKVKGEFVASRELTFLELAGELCIHRLILLGLQLCSHPPGLPSKAITTKRKLRIFLDKAEGHRGRRKAIRAVKFVQNGSASIMESLAYMILSLPNVLGGYGLDGVVLNHEIELQDDGKKRLAQRSCFTDLYYKNAKLAVEYDSFTFHSNPLEQGKDAIRAVVLKNQGIEVIHLSTIQLYDKSACKDFAYYLAARLGKRISIRTRKFDEMHALMRSLLPESKSDLESNARPALELRVQPPN